MIPKVIHYCWFGGAEIPEKDRKCIESWKKFCPDYEIKEWNESNYDIHKNKYMEQAYEAKKWGFVPDYARLDIIYHYGGFYLDTDVELIKSLDNLIEEKAFMGFENDRYVAPGLGFGAEKYSPIILYLMKIYENRSFIKEDGTLDMVASPVMNTQALVQKGLQKNGQYQILENELTIYPVDYFCPLDYEKRKMNITKNTYSIHHYASLWMPEEERKAHATRVKMMKKYGEKKGLFIAKFLNIPIRIKYHLRDKGLGRTLIFVIKKIFVRSKHNE